jgi:hypothetical protein
MNSIEEWTIPQTYPPWVLFDPDTKHEYVFEHTPHFAVVNVEGEWFVYQRGTDAIVPGTQSQSRADTIRKFYEVKGRPMPEGTQVPPAVKGTKHTGM